MKTHILIGALALSTLAGAATAQSSDGTGRSPQEEYQRGYAATPMPNQAAIDARGAPAVDALNGAAAAQSQAQGAIAGANQAQYDADRAAYIDALVRHDRAVNRSDARTIRQQNAYADAMAAWRAQADACRHGHPRACNAPTPNPADFY